MPKTNKKFDWEIFAEDGEFIDILVMSRAEMKEYQKVHPEYTVKELSYTDDGRDVSCDVDREKGRDVYRVRIPRR